MQIFDSDKMADCLFEFSIWVSLNSLYNHSYKGETISFIWLFSSSYKPHMKFILRYSVGQVNYFDTTN